MSNVAKFEYPEPIETDARSKIVMRRYRDKKTANRAAAVAKKHAKYRASQGYDFGYMTPGTIYESDDGTFQVVCP